MIIWSGLHDFLLCVQFQCYIVVHVMTALWNENKGHYGKVGINKVNY